VLTMSVDHAATATFSRRGGAAPTGRRVLRVRDLSFARRG
jgi:hypothetical protein